MEIEKRPWHVAIALTFFMSIATAIGTFASSYLLLGAKMREETERAAVERRAKGAQLACEKLQASATLAAEINFSADRGYLNAVRLSDIELEKENIDRLKVPTAQIMAEQLEFEKRASELILFLTESEAEILNRTTLHHYVVTSLRTSKVPPEQRVPPREGGFDANTELAGIRDGATRLAAAYRIACTEQL
ncbi:hypothetical protein [Vreelandella titanicae]|uniref:hypothetical protein n=1 Tax=Vreelandella titanicae TaxID=664683 RepID=UPI0039BF7D3F